MTFEDFWKLYPRRMARMKALKSWERLTEEQQAIAVQSLPAHIRYWEATATSGEFLPYPATWLNQERWTDELEMPTAKAAQNDWHRSQAGIEAKARELGMWPPRTGEDWHSLKARILARAA